jgi:hypothetical protein
MRHPVDELLDLLRQGFTVALVANEDQGDFHIIAAAANGHVRRFADCRSLAGALQRLNGTEPVKTCRCCGAERPLTCFTSAGDASADGKTSTCVVCAREEARSRRRKRNPKGG